MLNTFIALSVEPLRQIITRRRHPISSPAFTSSTLPPQWLFVISLWDGHWLLLWLALVGFALALASDLHHEQDELFIFVARREELRRELARFVPSAVWSAKS